MMKSLLIFAALIILIGANTSFAQGDFLEKGQSGFQLTGIYSSLANVHQITGNLSYSIDAAFDLGFSLGRTSIDNGAISGYIYGPTLIFHTNKKKNRAIPISLSYIFNFAISSTSIRDDAMPGYNDIIEMNGKHIGLGVALYANSRVASAFTIQPNFVIGYVYSNVDVKRYGRTEKFVSDKGIDYSVGVSLLIGKPKNQVIRIEFGLSTYKNETTFSTSLGIIKIT